jgi:hypothetical protein
LGEEVRIELVKIKAGTFLMGSPESDKEAYRDEKPQHEVSLTQDYYLGKEVDPILWTKNSPSLATPLQVFVTDTSV